MIFQVHSEHGRHIAYSPTEAENNEKNGWKTISKEEFFGEQVSKDTDSSDGDLIAAYLQKFGKKPHHKMKIDTIKAAVNGGNE